jgi:hypothetical protein
MTLIIYPPLVPPRCTRCLLSVCSDACLMKIDTRQIGERANWGHLHWECRCGFVWATMTALQSGRDAERQ